MTRLKNTISLLSYLKPGPDTFFLDIPVYRNPVTGPEESLFPLRSLGQSRKFSQVIEARIVMGTDKPVIPLYLLKQSDRYLAETDPLNDLSNTLIDSLWDQTVAVYSAEGTAHETFVFAGQKNNGSTTRFKSLFYCAEKKTFFHPPCPECGKDLDLCTDDRVLKQVALPDYSTTLDRYLYCPHCRASSDPDGFYHYDGHSCSRLRVNNRFDLVKRFIRLKGSGIETFPCLTCRWYSDCHVTGEKALQRINFFSFYPFAMVAVEAYPLRATEYLQCVSGADAQDIDTVSNPSPESGLSCIHGSSPVSRHGRSGFLFSGHARWFQEVLLLKLLFVGEIVRTLTLRTKAMAEPALTITAESIRVKTSGPGLVMPWLWTASIKLMDLPESRTDTSFSSVMPPGFHFHCLASLWFYTFLVNKSQPMETVCQNLRPVFDAVYEDDRAIENLEKLIENHPVLAPSNGVWQGLSRTLTRTETTCWESILRTGLLLQSRVKPAGVHQHLEHLQRSIEEIQAQLISSLFSLSPEHSATPAAQPDHSTPCARPQVNTRPEKAFGDDPCSLELILKKIRAQWGNGVPETPPKDSDDPECDDDVLETVVLSPDQNSADGFFETPLDKTVVLSAEQLRQLRTGRGRQDTADTMIGSTNTLRKGQAE